MYQVSSLPVYMANYNYYTIWFYDITEFQVSISNTVCFSSDFNDLSNIYIPSRATRKTYENVPMTTDSNNQFFCSTQIAKMCEGGQTIHAKYSTTYSTSIGTYNTDSYVWLYCSYS